MLLSVDRIRIKRTFLYLEYLPFRSRYLCFGTLSLDNQIKTNNQSNESKQRQKKINNLSLRSALGPDAWWHVSTNDGRSSSLRAIRKTTLSANGRRTDRRAFFFQDGVRIERIRNGKDGSNDLRWNSPMQVKYTSFATLQLYNLIEHSLKKSLRLVSIRVPKSKQCHQSSRKNKANANYKIDNQYEERMNDFKRRLNTDSDCSCFKDTGNLFHSEMAV